MKKYIIITSILLLLSTTLVFSQKKLNGFAVGFYNVENLFDTERDESINDVDFTPSGSYSWTKPKYDKKQRNLAYVIDKMGKEYCPAGLAILGVAEVENRKVLEDLVTTPPIAKVGFQIVHYDSPDKRGIDVALLYNPALFQVTSSKVYPYNLPDDPEFVTRDQLLVSGTLAGEPLHVIVNHWPSRYGGDKSSRFREFAASITKHITDSLYSADANAKIVIMGDLNDNPDDKSTRVVLDAKKKQSEVEKGGLFNTMWEFYDLGIGSLGYQGKWSLFDQIIISEPLLGDDRSNLKYWKSEIFNRDFLHEKTGKNKGYPHRTFRSNSFIDGYSDHFPTLIYLVKEASN